jgi:hypothetical protein
MTPRPCHPLGARIICPPPLRTDKKSNKTDPYWGHLEQFQAGTKQSVPKKDSVPNLSFLGTDRTPPYRGVLCPLGPPVNMQSRKAAVIVFYCADFRGPLL